jgi:shikimate dehydrogenase
MSLYGLIGFPLGHSFSQKYFTEKFDKEKITGTEYKLFPLEDISMLPALIAAHPGLRGLNVTVPYKEAVLPYLDKLDETAEAVGAVNCISVAPHTGLLSGEKSTEAPHSELQARDSKPQTPNYRLTGYNTDVHGFRQSIKPFLEMHHERALILGTGGASKAVHHVLTQIGIECYFVSRDPAGRQKHFFYSELTEYVIKAFPLIINTTPLGMYPAVNDLPPIPYEYITPRHLLYDLVYNPAETLFLKKGKGQGAATINGLSMLYAQAEKAWEIWQDSRQEIMGSGEQ